MIARDRDAIQDTGFGGFVVYFVMLFSFVFGIAILLSIAFVCDVFKNIFPR